MTGYPNKKKTFRSVLIRSTMVACVCAMLILGVTLIAVSMFSFSRQEREDMDYIISNVNAQFRDKIQVMEDMIVSVRHNSYFHAFFDVQEYDSEILDEQISYSMDLFSERNIVNTQYPFVESVYLFNTAGDDISEEYYPTTIAAREVASLNAKRAQEAFQKTELRYQYLLETDTISLCFRMYDNGMKESGTGIIILNKQAIESMFQDIEAYKQGKWLLTDIQGQVLCSGGLTEQEQAAGQAEETGLLTNQIDCGFGIRVFSAVGSENIYAALKTTISLFIIIFILILGGASVLMFLISYRYTRPLKEVADSIQTFGEGNLSAQVSDFDIQEFHDISVVFNDMTKRINYLVTQVYEKQLLASQAQIKYLRSQMDPHFQFNILSMLAIKSKMGQNEEVYQGLVAFSKLMQGKIFREQEIEIPLSQEMELVEFYLYLQNSRFKDKIKYEIIYQNEEAREDKIPRLTIEPLVENAVSHGLEPKEGPGTIRVTIFEDEKLHILIEDDGVGFDSENLSDVQQQSEEARPMGHTHTGIVNSMRLIHTLYGEGYGILVEGKKGAGTRVEVILPVNRGRYRHVENNDCR